LELRVVAIVLVVGCRKGDFFVWVRYSTSPSPGSFSVVVGETASLVTNHYFNLELVFNSNAQLVLLIHFFLSYYSYKIFINQKICLIIFIEFLLSSCFLAFYCFHLYSWIIPRTLFFFFFCYWLNKLTKSLSDVSNPHKLLTFLLRKLSLIFFSSPFMKKSFLLSTLPKLLTF